MENIKADESGQKDEDKKRENGLELINQMSNSELEEMLDLVEWKSSKRIIKFAEWAIREKGA